VDFPLEIGHESDHDVLFGAEVVVDGAFADVGGSSDFIDGDSVDISLAEQADAGLDDLGSGGGFRTFPSTDFSSDHSHI
jgi:hypothetical protein